MDELTRNSLTHTAPLFEFLPEEIKKQIFSYPQTIAVLTSWNFVCKNWHYNISPCLISKVLSQWFNIPLEVTTGSPQKLKKCIKILETRAKEINEYAKQPGPLLREDAALSQKVYTHYMKFVSNREILPAINRHAEQPVRLQDIVPLEACTKKAVSYDAFDSVEKLMKMGQKLSTEQRLHVLCRAFTSDHFEDVLIRLNPPPSRKECIQILLTVTVFPGKNVKLLLNYSGMSLNTQIRKTLFEKRMREYAPPTLKTNTIGSLICNTILGNNYVNKEVFLQVLKDYKFSATECLDFFKEIINYTRNSQETIISFIKATEQNTSIYSDCIKSLHKIYVNN